MGQGRSAMADRTGLSGKAQDGRSGLCGKRGFPAAGGKMSLDRCRPCAYFACMSKNLTIATVSYWYPSC